MEAHVFALCLFFYAEYGFQDFFVAFARINTPSYATGSSSGVSSMHSEKELSQRDIMREVCLRVQADTVLGETVLVCGSTAELGEWQVARARPMHLEHPTTKIWTLNVMAPLLSTVEFRYLIGVILDCGRVIVRRWESVIHPRTICPNVDKNASIDIFANYDGEEKVESGWLTSETAVQFKFFGKAVVLWKKKYRSVPLSFRITPIDIAHRCSEALVVSEDSEQQSNISDFECVKWPIIEIAVMKEEGYEFRQQEQFGHLYSEDEFVVCQSQVMRAESIAYMVDYYIHKVDETIPEHIGFSYILPGNLTEAAGTFTVPITGNRHQPVGQLKVSYLVVKPLNGYSCSCRQTFTRFWKKTNRTLDVGHRGAGNARRTDKVENVLENTIASFNYAARHGADMVELDVQLSRDKVPVIYHDYYICIHMKKRKSPLHEDEKLKLAVRDLSVAQLQHLKLAPSEAHSYDFHEDDQDENQPFPTLQHVLEAVDPSVGFNVEIKCPMQLHDGTWEMDGNFDLNEYMDIVLKTLLDYSGNRYIILSCFHPDICTMIRLKQNKYPLLFLTQGQTEKYPPYLDPRTSTVHIATYFALCTDILGVNVHTEDLLKNPALIPFIKKHKLILFCWGEDNNHSDTISSLKMKGVDGVIYDKVDLFISGSRERENVYLVQPNDTPGLAEAAASHSRDSLQESSMPTVPA
ncbi:glycerophosphocholine phosphodiesterase GPCPD1-like isoform X2 [Ornithodoros turicata]|uniref:glycerophosphocholine phosphodiesterase GPCPD1-like isoform X2 n=1 Tax=Ornithodoros turicata TaxID=34597 RepID=UPI003139F27C